MAREKYNLLYNTTYEDYQGNEIVEIGKDVDTETNEDVLFVFFDKNLFKKDHYHITPVIYKKEEKVTLAVHMDNQMMEERIRRRIIVKKPFVILVFLIVFSICPINWTSVSAEEYFVFGDYEYTLMEDGTARITNYTGKEEELTIPDHFANIKVTSIEVGAFGAYGEDRDLIAVRIPDSVTSIEGNPFCYNLKLKTIVVSPDHPTLALIDGVLFSKPDKRLVCYPAGSTESVYSIPEGIRVIGVAAFLNCRLERVVIPDTVKTIGANAFAVCESLVEVEIPESVTLIESKAFAGAALRSVEVPAGVETIGDWAFNCGSYLQSVVLHEGLKTIGEWAFNRCDALQSIDIPDGVTSIGAWAFGNCSSLSSVCIPASVETINRGAFDNISESCVFTVARDSAAANYCKRQGLQFVYFDANDWLKDD